MPYGPGSAEPVRLVETGPGVVRALRPAQVAALLTRPDLVRIAPAPGGRWRLSGNQTVGLVTLGRGEDAVELHIAPKLPVAQLMFLLTYAPGDPWQGRPVAAASAAGLLPAVADAFARATRRALESGVLHGYRTTDEDLPVIRGRIRTTDQMRRTGLPLPIAVRYDDFTADIAENRLLLAALHRLERLRGVDPNTRLLLRHLAGHLTGVTPPLPGAAPPTWTSNRLNSRYTPALRLAELVLADRTLAARGAAPVVSDGFALHLPTVFETFLTRALSAALRPHRIRSAAQERHHRLDLGARIRIRPDLVLYRAGRPLAVLDAKYRALGTAPPPTEHVYQLIGYCTALNLPHGHLLYASGESGTPGESGAAAESAPPTPYPTPYPIRHTGITVSTHVVDLGRPPEELLASVAALAARMADGAR